MNPLVFEAAQRLAHEVAKCEPVLSSPRAFLVGGCVRDELLGVSTNDLDMEVFGVPGDVLESLVQNLFPGRVQEVGKSFGILKITLENGGSLDVALPRRESKQGQGHTGFLIISDPDLSIKDAARRRDFTVNALYLDPLTGERLDPFGGEADLHARRLRMVDAATFVEDPLRVFRAIQFAGRFAFDVEPETRALITRMSASGELETLSAERITEEWKKLFLKAKQPSLGLTLAREIGVIERLYPELSALWETPQEPEWHPEGDVWIHTLMCVDEAARLSHEHELDDQMRLELIIGTLCHDLGKPSTTHKAEKDGVMRIRSLGHQEAGEKPTRTLLEKWTFGHDVMHAAIMIARNHLQPGLLWISKEKGELSEAQYKNAVRKLVTRVYPLDWRILLLSAEADYRGRSIPNIQDAPHAHGQEMRRAITELGLDQEAPKPLLQGRDVMTLGIAPGPAVGELLQKIENARDQGTITTKEEALALLKTFL